MPDDAHEDAVGDELARAVERLRQVAETLDRMGEERERARAERDRSLARGRAAGAGERDGQGDGGPGT